MDKYLRLEILLSRPGRGLFLGQHQARSRKANPRNYASRVANGK
jgi:hypothetical protein